MTGGVRAVVVALLVARSVPVRAEPPPVIAIARAVVNAQLANIADPAAWLAGLAPAAVVLGNGSLAVAGTSAAPAVAAELTRSRSGLPPLAIEIASLEAQGEHDAIWLEAHLSIIHAFPRGRASAAVTTVRLTELAVLDGEAWRVVAVAFDAPSGGSAPTLTFDRPKRGSLTSLLGDPDQLEHELVASGDLAIGVADARRDLAAWHRAVELVGAIEVRTATYAWAAGELVPDANEPHPGHLRVLVLATREAGARERWQVVAVHASVGPP